MSTIRKWSHYFCILTLLFFSFGNGYGITLCISDCGEDCATSWVCQPSDFDRSFCCEQDCGQGETALHVLLSDSLPDSDCCIELFLHSQVIDFANGRVRGSSQVDPPDVSALSPKDVFPDVGFRNHPLLLQRTYDVQPLLIHIQTVRLIL
jgi:hypothetical protein